MQTGCRISCHFKVFNKLTGNCTCRFHCACMNTEVLPKELTYSWVLTLTHNSVVIFVRGLGGFFKRTIHPNPNKNQIDCSRFATFLSDGRFAVKSSKPEEWTHIVMNYIGPNSSEGIRIYYDGEEVARETRKSSGSNSPGDSRIVVGRLYTNLNNQYARVRVDELFFFNQVLTYSDIEVLYKQIG